MVVETETAYTTLQKQVLVQYHVIKQIILVSLFLEWELQITCIWSIVNAVKLEISVF